MAVAVAVSPGVEVAVSVGTAVAVATAVGVAVELATAVGVALEVGATGVAVGSEPPPLPLQPPIEISVSATTRIAASRPRSRTVRSIHELAIFRSAPGTPPQTGIGSPLAGGLPGAFSPRQASYAKIAIARCQHQKAASEPMPYSGTHATQRGRAE